jgi:hypothetical protein
MKLLSILPAIIVVESTLAGLYFAVSRQWGSALYWFSAAIINFAAVYGIKTWG